MALCAAAGSAAAPASASVDPDSAAPTVTRTACADGGWALSTSPARGFNPLTATAAQLDANNYPIRPPKADAAAYALWVKFVSRPGALASTCADGTANSQTAGVTSSTTFTNWSGYVAHQADFTEAEATWEVPAVDPVAGSNQYSASWVGLGLGQSATLPLIQAGTNSDYVNGSAQYSIWYEIVPQISAEQVLATAHPGDEVGVHIRYVPNEPPIFHIWDLNTNFNYQRTYAGTWNSSWHPDGHAEWIYERPRLGGFTGKLPYLANAAPIFAQAQAARNGSWEYINDASDILSSMVNCNATQTLAGPSAIANGGTFVMEFHNKGDNMVC